MRDIVMQRLRESRIVAIMRGVPADMVTDIARALVLGGIRVMEITIDTRDALKMISEVRSTFDDSVSIGVGTVLDSETARTALLAGAEFIVTPTLNRDVVTLGNRYGVPVFPGALTPTEILSAFEAGASAVKVFPASVLGADYIKQVRGPLSHIPLVPTGGVGTHNASEYINAGALAIGTGGRLLEPAVLANKDMDEITKRARELVDIIAGKTDDS